MQIAEGGGARIHSHGAIYERRGEGDMLWREEDAADKAGNECGWEVAKSGESSDRENVVFESQCTEDMWIPHIPHDDDCPTVLPPAKWLTREHRRLLIVIGAPRCLTPRLESTQTRTTSTKPRTSRHNDDSWLSAGQSGLWGLQLMFQKSSAPCHLWGMTFLGSPCRVTVLICTH